MLSKQRLTERNFQQGKLSWRRTKEYLRRLSIEELKHRVLCLKDLGSPSGSQESRQTLYQWEVDRRLKKVLPRKKDPFLGSEPLYG